MTKISENLIRVSIIALVGIIVYFGTMYMNERKAVKLASIQQVMEVAKADTSPPVAQQQAVSAVPGFDPEDLKKPKAEKAEDAVTAAMDAVASVPVATNPVKENQQEDDRIKLHFDQMSGQEKSLADAVAGAVVDDYVSVRKVFVGDVNIQDSYRLVNPTEEQEYGMGDYEYIIRYKNKCEIAEVSVNYRNNGEPRVLGYRRC